MAPFFVAAGHKIKVAYRGGFRYNVHRKVCAFTAAYAMNSEQML